ncbi:MAG: MGMT family protein [Patescibacteria group bacterium]
MMTFSEKVLAAVKKIPPGRVTTYKKLAEQCGRPLAARAVGRILNASKFSFFENISEKEKIPCHRVIKSDGTIGGYSKGAKKKIVLLKREGININNGRLLAKNE